MNKKNINIKLTNDDHVWILKELTRSDVIEIIKDPYGKIEKEYKHDLPDCLVINFKQFTDLAMGSKFLVQGIEETSVVTIASSAEHIGVARRAFANLTPSQDLHAIILDKEKNATVHIQLDGDADDNAMEILDSGVATKAYANKLTNTKVHHIRIQKAKGGFQHANSMRCKMKAFNKNGPIPISYQGTRSWFDSLKNMKTNAVPPACNVVTGRKTRDYSGSYQIEIDMITFKAYPHP